MRARMAPVGGVGKGGVRGRAQTRSIRRLLIRFAGVPSARGRAPPTERSWPHAGASPGVA
ncbi:MAG: hypothetical protein CML46_02275 [Rhodobacteraceae bacterium]|nr:hypothetical protein [Paracoccaceae bacterium]